MSHFDDLQLFCTVALQRSFFKAAKQLSLPHSTVSRRVAALERALGQQLIIRTTRSMRLTETGEALLQKCNPLLNQLDWAMSDALDETDVLQGSLTLSMPTRVGLDYMGQYLIDFAKLHPELNINISLSNEMVDLVKDGVDIGFRVGPLADSSLLATTLWDIPFSVVATQTYIDKFALSPDNFSVSELHNLPCAIAPPQQQWNFIDRQNSVVSVTPKAGIQVNDLTLALQAAINGIAIAYVPNIVLQRFAQASCLTTLHSPDWQPMTRTMYAVFNEKRSHSAKIKTVIEYVSQRYATDYSK